VAVYFLSSAMPAVLGALVMLYVFYRKFGVMAALGFAIIWIFDKELSRATFQLSPTGAGLLPLSLIVLLFVSYSERRLSDLAFTTYFVLLLFWMYGAKETNVFFVPGALVVIGYLAGWRKLVYALAMGAGLYVLETAAFMTISGNIGFGGRLGELVGPKAVHLSMMFDVERLIAEQESYWDAGILSRWYRIREFHLLVYLASIALFFGLFFKGLRRKPVEADARMAFMVAVIGASFVFFSSFFIVSLDPVRMGQPVRDRYVAILLPLSFFIIYRTFALTNWKHFATIAFFALLVSSTTASVTSMLLKRQFIEEFPQQFRRYVLFGDFRPLSVYRDYYTAVGEVSASTLCVDARGHRKMLIFAPMYVPVASRGPGFQQVWDAEPVINDEITVRGVAEGCPPGQYLPRPRQVLKYCVGKPEPDVEMPPLFEPWCSAFRAAATKAVANQRVPSSLP